MDYETHIRNQEKYMAALRLEAEYRCASRRLSCIRIFSRISFGYSCIAAAVGIFLSMSTAYSFGSLSPQNGFFAGIAQIILTLFAWILAMVAFSKGIAANLLLAALYSAIAIGAFFQVNPPLFLICGYGAIIYLRAVFYAFDFRKLKKADGYPYFSVRLSTAESDYSAEYYTLPEERRQSADELCEIDVEKNTDNKNE